MSDELDALERELAAMRPCPLSPAVERRIAGRLNNRRRCLLAATGVLAAACLAIAMLICWQMRRGEEQANRLQQVPSPLPPAEDEVWPTLGGYRQALAQSPEALESLLDRQADRARRSESQRASTAMSVRFDDSLLQP